MPTVAPYTPGPPSASPIELAFGCVQEYGGGEGEYEGERGHEGEGYYDGEGEGEAMAHSCVQVDPLFPGRKYATSEDCHTSCTWMPPCDRLRSETRCLIHSGCFWDEARRKCTPPSMDPPTVAPFTPASPSASPIEVAFGCVQEYGGREGEYEGEGEYEPK
eukprot:gene17313-biopygen380